MKRFIVLFLIIGSGVIASACSDHRMTTMSRRETVETTVPADDPGVVERKTTIEQHSHSEVEGGR